jgi:hypothetical protein
MVWRIASAKYAVHGTASVLRDVGVVGLAVVQFPCDELKRRVDGGRAACRVGLSGGLHDWRYGSAGKIRGVFACCLWPVTAETMTCPNSDATRKGSSQW